MRRRRGSPVSGADGSWLLLLVCASMCLRSVRCRDNGDDYTSTANVTGFNETTTNTGHDTQTERSYFPTQGHAGRVSAISETQLGTTLDNVDLVNVTTTVALLYMVTINGIVTPATEANNLSGKTVKEWNVATEGNSEYVSRFAQCDTCNGSYPATTSWALGEANTTYLGGETATTPLWRRIMNAGLLGMAGTGVVANTMTFVTLTVNGRSFSRLTVVLLKHQALIDAAVCALASGVFMQTSVWHVGQYAVDYAVCYIWHSQYIYWGVALLSVWNLVFIAIDRLIAVCFPIKYKSLSSRGLKIAIAIMYVPCFLSPAPSIRLVTFTHGQCILGITLPPDLAEAFYYWFSIYWLFVAYIVPMVSFLLLYGRTVLQLRHHRKAIASAVQSQTLTKSTIRVTKCAITLTVIFAATISYDSIYFCLGNVGVTSYHLGAPVQLVGILMTVCNSLANPFMYAIFMPTFRRSLRRTICRRGNAVQDDATVMTVGSII
ncbi:hypothetical protein LSAT2_001540 [Lamellibrachia satsuma]|nr:hypothetical protein LSAT2_001540 [Lamellibrachia satsuma]